MAYEKQTFESGETLYAAQLNAMDDQIAENEASCGDVQSQITRMKEQQPYLFAEYQTGNLIDQTKMIIGERIGSDGNPSALASACRTDYIDITKAQGTHLAMYARTADSEAYKRAFYRMAFYDAEKTMVSYHESGDENIVNDSTKAFVEIPENAVYIRVSYMTKNESWVYEAVRGSTDMPLDAYPYSPIRIATVPYDLNEKLAVIDELAKAKHQDDSEFTVTTLNNSTSFSQNDITFVGDELWVSKENATYYTNGTMIFRYKIVNGEFELVGTCDCDFGHLNTMDYCAANDCLIFGNGGNGTETTDNYFVVVKNPLALGSAALIADVGIKYDVDIGYKVQALWGGSNLGGNNIVYLLSNDSATITKVLLKKDDSGTFNGEFVALETNTVEAWGVQGADIFGDTLYIGGQVNGNEFAAVKEISLSDLTQSRIVKRKFYADDGTAITGCVQGIYVDRDAVWICINSGDSTRPVCITKYHK